MAVLSATTAAKNINQFTSPPPTPAMSETSSGNTFNETEGNDFDQRNVYEEENQLYIKQLLST